MFINVVLFLFVFIIISIFIVRFMKFLCEKFDWEITFIQKTCCILGFHWKIEPIGVGMFKCSGCEKIGTSFDSDNIEF